MKNLIIFYNQLIYNHLKLFILHFSLFISVLSACQPIKKQEKTEITVAVAANAQMVMEVIEQVFVKENPSILVKNVVGSSGQLTAQIQNGAPFSIFVSADMKYPQTLFEKKWSNEKPKIYAQGVAILWTFKSQKINDLNEFLLDKNVKKIAIPNSKNAPYGAVAEQYLKENQLYEKIKDKLVFGESVSQVNQYIIAQWADAGFTALSATKAPNLKEKGNFMVLKAPPIPQGAVILKYGKEKNAEASQKFFDFLFSAQAQKIFTDFGYEK